MFPLIILLLELTIAMPCRRAVEGEVSPLPEMTLSGPMGLLLALFSTRMPFPVLPNAFVPAAFVPILFPWIVLLLEPFRRIPSLWAALSPLPEMTLSGPIVLPLHPLSLVSRVFRHIDKAVKLCESKFFMMGGDR